MTEYWAEKYSPSSLELLIHSNLTRRDGYQVPQHSSQHSTRGDADPTDSLCILLMQADKSRQIETKAGESFARMPANVSLGFCIEVFTFFY